MTLPSSLLHLRYRLICLLLSAVFIFTAGVARADCDAERSYVAQTQAALSTARVQGTASAGLGGLQSNIQSQEQAYNVAVAALNACLRRANLAGGMVGGPAGGGSKIQQFTNGMMGMMGTMMGMMQEREDERQRAAQIEAQQEARRAAEAAATKAALEAQDAQRRAAMSDPFTGAGKGFATGSDNPFTQGAAGSGVSSDNNPFAGPASSSTENSVRCHYGDGDQSACQALANDAAAERARSIATAPNAAAVQQNIDNLNQMYRGGGNAPGGQFPDMVSSARAGYIAQQSAANQGASSDVPAFRAIAPGAPARGSKSDTPNLAARHASDATTAMPGGQGPLAKPGSDEISNPFVGAQDAPAPPMQLGDPKGADLPNRLPLNSQDCLARHGQVIVMPGSPSNDNRYLGYCVVSTDWYYLEANPTAKP